MEYIKLSIKFTDGTVYSPDIMPITDVWILDASIAVTHGPKTVFYPWHTIYSITRNKV